MSRRNKRKRHMDEMEYVPLPEKYGPKTDKRSSAQRLCDWIIFGNDDDKEAMYEIFPTPRV